MTRSHNSASGFAHMAFIVILVVALGIGAIAYVVNSRQVPNDTVETVSTSADADDPEGKNAPSVESDADLETADKSLDEFNPDADSEDDAEAIDSQIKDL